MLPAISTHNSSVIHIDHCLKTLFFDKRREKIIYITIQHYVHYVTGLFSLGMATGYAKLTTLLLPI